MLARLAALPPPLRRRTLWLVVALALVPAPAAPRPDARRAAEAALAPPCRQGSWSSGAAGERRLRPSIVAFCRLGAWVDHYDVGLDPVASARDLARHRVGTLYLQTGRYSDAADLVRPELLGRWLQAAHAAGLRVVGWYLPGYGRWLERDVRRTVAVAGFRGPGGQAFDALAVDVEHREPGDREAFDAGVAAHLARVRRQVGTGYPIGAIVPAPLGMALYAARWAGFPWRSIAADADVVQTMGYWSYREGCRSGPGNCPYAYTSGNLADAARLTGLPVHAIGGVADAVSAADVAEFVRAARDGRAVGASLYDYATTQPAFWPSLERLARPG
ncbi:MAG TPA: hypothetical protein VGM21_06890 [Actinomycetota bacterium]|jgi:hypothetical protein